MLETFKAQLKAKAKTLGVTNLSNKRIDAFAATLEKKHPNLATDDDHTEKVDELLELVDLKEIAALDDYNRTKAAKKGDKQDDKKDDPTTKKEGDDPNHQQQQPADDMPAWAKALVDSNKALTEKLNSIETEKSQLTIRQKIAEKLTDVPEPYWSKMALPSKEEDIETFTAGVSQDWVNLGLSTSTKPHVPGGPSIGTPSKEQVDAVISNF